MVVTLRPGSNIDYYHCHFNKDSLLLYQSYLFIGCDMLQSCENLIDQSLFL